MDGTTWIQRSRQETGRITLYVYVTKQPYIIERVTV